MRAFALGVARAFAGVRGVAVAVELNIEMTTAGESRGSIAWTVLNAAPGPSRRTFEPALAPRDSCT